MTARKILVPYNFTVDDRKALDFVVDAFGNRQDVRITLFHAYTPLPEIDVTASPELRKVMPGVQHLTRELEEKQRGLAAARTYLMEHGVLGELIDTSFKKRQKGSAEEIIDAVRNGGFDVIVLSRKSKRLTALFERSIHRKLLVSLEKTTVCLAS
jgi:nucleotide-binding universal stress UspA family protein